MDITITPHKLAGTVSAIPSKSVAHRLLICAAFADKPTELYCPQINEDISATADCLNALGAEITRTGNGYRIIPAANIPVTADLYCRESGSTLRFLLPVVGALGVHVRFHTEGRLGLRPLSPLWEEMERMGCVLKKESGNLISCTGKLRCGSYHMDGSVSSQFISGLLFAMALLPGRSTLTLEGTIESAPYIEMTKQALALFGLDLSNNATPENHFLHSPGNLTVEGDWSNAAFFFCANAIGNSIDLQNLNYESVQGDRFVLRALNALESCCEIDAKDIPDLVPILSVIAGAKKGAQFHNINRLRLKESDRVESVCKLLSSIGGKAEADENTLTVFPASYIGGIVDAMNDHRIAMAAGIAATICSEPVTILGAECVKKSYPSFWEQYKELGGIL